jgi:hypothetical protein
VANGLMVEPSTIAVFDPNRSSTDMKFWPVRPSRPTPALSHLPNAPYGRASLAGRRRVLGASGAAPSAGECCLSIVRSPNETFVRQTHARSAPLDEDVR